MLLAINPSDAIPIYHQIVRQVKHAVASGRLKPGDRMPSQRDLAGKLIISHLTVKKAYDLLEAEGVITTRRGRGTFVADAPDSDLRAEGLEQLRTRVRELADVARLLGVEREDCVDMLSKAWQKEKEYAL